MKKKDKDEPRKPLGQWLVENVPRGTNLEVPDRKSQRLRDYDYSLPGAYAITIVTQSRLCLFGKVICGEMHLNQAGMIVQQSWEELPHRFPSIELDAFVVMPNHVHGIIVLHRFVGASLVGARSFEMRSITATTDSVPRLGDVVGAYKSLSSIGYMRGVKKYGWQRFPGRLWQRNYFERVIRDEAEMERAREYIVNNPIEWGMDPENLTVQQDGQPQGLSLRGGGCRKK